MKDWLVQKKSSGLKIIAELDKAYYMQGLKEERIQMIVGVKGSYTMKQLIESLVEKKDAKKSGKYSKFYNNRRPMTSIRSTHQSQYKIGDIPNML